MFDFRAAVLETLPSALKKRTKNSEKSVAELKDLLGECRNHLLSQINGPKGGETLQFESEMLSSLLESIRHIRSDIKDSQCLTEALDTLQLFLIIIPSGNITRHRPFLTIFRT